VLLNEFTYKPKLSEQQFFKTGFTEWKCLFICDVAQLLKKWDKELKRGKGYRQDTGTATSSVVAVRSLGSDRREEMAQSLAFEHRSDIPVPQEKPVDLYRQEDESLLEMASDRLIFRVSTNGHCREQRTPSPTFGEFSIHASPISKAGTYDPSQYVSRSPAKEKTPNRYTPTFTQIYNDHQNQTPPYQPSPQFEQEQYNDRSSYPQPSNLQIQILESHERMRELEIELRTSKQEQQELRFVMVIY
jgi:hypothetical protein